MTERELPRPLAATKHDRIELQIHVAACDRPIGGCVPCQIWFGLHPTDPRNHDG